MNTHRVFACLGLISLFLSCASVNSQTAESLYPVKEISDLDYYSGPDADSDKHKLDLYLPEGLKAYPTMLWIHGGAWIAGGRKQEAELARRFAERGVGMVVISYRLSPGTWQDPKLTEGIQHPEHIRDCIRALKWTIENGRQYGIDTDKIIASGYSAGGHLSALMATDPSYLKEAGLDTSALLGAVPIAGAYDMVAYYHAHLEGNGRKVADGHVLGVFGDLETAKKASPTEYLYETQIPMLIISETDTYGYTRVYENILKKTSIDHIRFYHDRSRNHRVLFFALMGEEPCDTRDGIIQYVNQLAEK